MYVAYLQVLWEEARTFKNMWGCARGSVAGEKQRSGVVGWACNGEDRPRKEMEMTAAIVGAHEEVSWEYK